MRRIGLKTCPYCGCSKIYATASRTLWQKMSALFFLRLVRCHVCMRRHYQPVFMSAPENPVRAGDKNKAQPEPAEVLSIKDKEKRTA